MTNKELRRLSRADLLEMMLAVTKENEQLRQSVAQMKSHLDDRRISIENCGSLAEAVLQINGVMEAAQAACEQYVLNIQERNANQEQILRQKEEEAARRCEEMLAKAQLQADEILANAGRRAEQMLAQAQSQIQKRNSEYDWLTQLLDSEEK